MYKDRKPESDRSIYITMAIVIIGACLLGYFQVDPLEVWHVVWSYYSGCEYAGMRGLTDRPDCPIVVNTINL